jgi:Outer membrane protein (OmpH-like)
MRNWLVVRDRRTSGQIARAKVAGLPLAGESPAALPRGLNRKLTGFCPLAAILLLSAIAGCRKQDSSSDNGNTPIDRVAVVDMDQVAKDLGWTDELNSNRNTLNDHFRDQVARTSEQYKAAIAKVQASFPRQADGKLTPIQQEAVSEMFALAQRIINQMQSTGNAEFDDYCRKCLTQYRNAITPFVRDVAVSRKMSVVLTVSNDLLYRDSAVDLTDAVSSAAREHVPVLTPIPMPTLNEAPPLPVPHITQTVPATAP